MIYSIFCTRHGKTISPISEDYADDVAAIEMACFYLRRSAADTARVHRGGPLYPLDEMIAELKTDGEQQSGPGNSWKNMRCPKCGDEHQLDITVRCAACDHHGTMRDFKAP